MCNNGVVVAVCAVLALGFACAPSSVSGDATVGAHDVVLADLEASETPSSGTEIASPTETAVHDSTPTDAFSDGTGDDSGQDAAGGACEFTSFMPMLLEYVDFSGAGHFWGYRAVADEAEVDVNFNGSPP